MLPESGLVINDQLIKSINRKFKKNGMEWEELMELNLKLDETAEKSPARTTAQSPRGKGKTSRSNTLRGNSFKKQRYPVNYLDNSSLELAVDAPAAHRH